MAVSPVWTMNDLGWLTWFLRPRRPSSRIVNLVVAVLMVLGGISQFFPIGLYVSLPPSRFPRAGWFVGRVCDTDADGAIVRCSQSSIIGVYVIIFGLGESDFLAPSMKLLSCSRAVSDRSSC